MRKGPKKKKKENLKIRPNLAWLLKRNTCVVMDPSLWTFHIWFLLLQTGVPHGNICIKIHCHFFNIFYLTFLFSNFLVLFQVYKTLIPLLHLLNHTSFSYFPPYFRASHFSSLYLYFCIASSGVTIRNVQTLAIIRKYL